MKCTKPSLKLLLFIILGLVIFDLPLLFAAKNNRNAVVEDLVDFKEFKKLLRTKNNVLVCFVDSIKTNVNVIKVFRESAPSVKGYGTMVLFDCSVNDVKKLCKKLKVSPSPYVIKHYKEGEFHKDYDRSVNVNSITNFMRDPTGDLPWEEDVTAADVYHIPDVQALSKFLKRETGSAMIMFYAPWCGFCKQLKPDYSAAATELKGHSILAAIDVNRPENSVVRTAYNITGFPTLIYYENGVKKTVYEGENKKESLVKFMRNPTMVMPNEKVRDIPWSDLNSDITFLTSETFDSVRTSTDSLLIMFYAPWCGHCKRMKPDYERAAVRIKEENIPGVLAAVDATQEQQLAKKYNVNGYPTIKYFSQGEFKFDIVLREEDKIVSFMKDPKEPPPPPPPEQPWSEQESEVVHLTQDNFKPFLKKKKNVLVMFYAPWCGHCKKAKPEFESAAQVFADDPKIELAAVDCTQHEAVCSAYNVRGYPTIKLFNYLNKQPVVDYDGGRTKDDFVQFMSQFQPLDQKSSGVTDAPASGKTEESDWGNEGQGVKLIKFLNEGDLFTTIKNTDCLLIFFYTPWCGHCKRMKKDFAGAALKLKELNNNCLLAACNVDGKEELAIDLDIKGFPAVKLYKNGKFAVNYFGKRTVSALVEFITNPTLQVASDPRKDEL